MSQESSEPKKKRGLTWAEAARLVLEKEGREMTHKEILQQIETYSLKDVRVKSRVTKQRGNPSLACLNAMLHHHSRSPSDYFYKVEGKMCCYGINKDRVERPPPPKQEQKVPVILEQDDFSDDEGAQSDSSSTVTASSTASLNLSSEDNRPGTSPSRSSPTPNTCSELQVTLPRVPLTTSVTLPPASSFHSNGYATSENLLQPVMDSGIGSLPGAGKTQRKRGPKPKTQGKPTVKKPRMTVAHMRQLERERAERERQIPKLVIKAVPIPDGSPNSHQSQQVQYIAEAKAMEPSPAPSLQATIGATPGPSVTAVPPEPQPVAMQSGGHPLVDPSFANNVIKVPKKRYYKKMSIATQMKRTKEGRIDLQSPDSILTTINLRNLLNEYTFSMLPVQYQTQLLNMFPSVDQVATPEGGVRPSPTALSNEFFASACQLWKERLMDGEFTPEVIQKLKQDEEKQAKRDPWKERYFEQVWGERSLPQLPTQVLLESADMKAQLATYHMSHPSATATSFTTLNPQPSATNQNNENQTQPETSKPSVITPSSATETNPKNVTAKKVVKKALTVAQMRAQQQGNKLPTPKPKQIRVTASRRAEALKRVKEMQAVRRNALMNNIQTPISPEDLYKDDDSTEEVKLQSSDDIPVQSKMTHETTGKGHSRSSSKSRALSSQANTSRISSTFRTLSSPGSSCSCQLKAMMVCRKCGAFCHSDCLGSVQQQLCTMCVVN